MTIFRIDVDQDLAKIVEKGPKRLKDKELEKALKEFHKLDGLRDILRDLKAMSDAYVKDARNVYTICDKRLKDKTLSKDDREELLFIRKKAYDFTMTLKKAGLA